MRRVQSPVAPVVGVIAILAVNYLRQALIPPGDFGEAASIALFAATTALVAVVVTVIDRRLGGRR